MTSSARRVIAAVTLIVSAACVEAAQPQADVNKPAWYKGVIVQTYAVIPKPDGSVVPDASRRDDVAYLVGYIFDQSPFGGEIKIPNAPLVVPAHDDVFTRWAYDRRPSDLFGFWIVPGPAAIATEGDPQQNVRVRPMPAGSLAGAPLAYAVKHKGRWRYLTSADAVETGIDYGLLTAVPSNPAGGFGGVGWLALAFK